MKIEHSILRTIKKIYLIIFVLKNIFSLNNKKTLKNKQRLTSRILLGALS